MDYQNVERAVSAALDRLLKEIRVVDLETKGPSHRQASNQDTFTTERALHDLETIELRIRKELAVRRARLARIHNRTLPIHNLSVEIFTNILLASVDPEVSFPFYELASVASYWRMILTTYRQVFLRVKKSQENSEHNHTKSPSPLNSWEMVTAALPSPSMKWETPRQSNPHETPPQRTRIPRVQKSGVPVNLVHRHSPKESWCTTIVHDVPSDGMNGDQTDVKATQCSRTSEATRAKPLARPITAVIGLPYWCDDNDKDPLCVAEYAEEIIQTCREREDFTMPDPNYMDRQEGLAWRMRGILSDWLIQIHARFRLLPETIFLAVNIIDRFLGKRVVSITKLQLVGITALFIAAKYEEIVSPSTQQWCNSADSNYGPKDIVEAEKYILRTLDWELSYPSPYIFLRQISLGADGARLLNRTVAKYLIEIYVVEHRLLGTRPSLLAASAMWLAMLMLRRGEWADPLIQYSGYTEDAILPVATLILNYILKPLRHEHLHRKYSAHKFCRVAQFVHSWTRELWAEGDTVDLADRLPQLRRTDEEMIIGEEDLSSRLRELKACTLEYLDTWHT